MVAAATIVRFPPVVMGFAVMSFVVMVCDINMVCMVPGLCLALL